MTGAHKGRILMLKGDLNTNEITGEWLGSYGVSARRLFARSGRTNLFGKKMNMKVDIINVGEWRELDEDQKLK